MSTDEKMNALSAAKRALLEKRLRGKNVEKTDAVSAADARLPVLEADTARRHDPFGFLPYQQQLWDATRTTGITPWFHLETHRGDLDLDRFEKVWRILIARHDMLRAIVLPDGTQQILQNAPAIFEIGREDWTALSATEQDARIEQLRSLMLAQPRRQDQWPLFEIRACKLGPQEYRLHFGFNMQVLDLASLELLAFECRRLYEDDSVELKQLEISFRDLVLGEAMFATQPMAKRSHDYWQGRLAALPAPIDLTDTASDTPRFVHHQSVLPAAAWSGIKDIARRHGITESMVVFAAFNEILSAYGERDRYSLESRIFRRVPLHKNIYDVGGQFVAGIVSEIDFGAPATFLERCRQLERGTWKDLENAYVDATRLWDTQAGRAAHAPSVVYTSTIAHFQNLIGAEPPIKWFGRQLFSAYQVPNLGLEFYVVVANGTLESHWFANGALFETGKLESMFDDFTALLQTLADDTGVWEQQALLRRAPIRTGDPIALNATGADA